MASEALFAENPQRLPNRGSMFPGSPQPKKAPRPLWGDKLPREQAHSNKLRFNTHEAAVAFCKQQNKHLQISVERILIEDKIVKKFCVIV